jgi:hypothetical protein
MNAMAGGVRNGGDQRSARIISFRVRTTLGHDAAMVTGKRCINRTNICQSLTQCEQKCHQFLLARHHMAHSRTSDRARQKARVRFGTKSANVPCQRDPLERIRINFDGRGHSQDINVTTVAS